MKGLNSNVYSYNSTLSRVIRQMSFEIDTTEKTDFNIHSNGSNLLINTYVIKNVLRTFDLIQVGGLCH